MKELHRINNISIGTYDDCNMYVSEVHVVKEGETKGQEKMTNTTYHVKLYHALQEACRRLSGSKAESLKEYMTLYTDAEQRLRDAVKGC